MAWNKNNLNMNKKYFKPTTTVIYCNINSIMVGSYCNDDKDDKKRCDSNCKIWHICQDREYGCYCKDYKY